MENAGKPEVGPGEITVLLRSWSEGSGEARERLMPLVYDALRAHARRELSREHRLSVTATGLVHQLYLRLTGYQAPQLHDRQHFMAFCARLMRQILTDEARAVLSQKRGSGQVLAPLRDELAWIGERDTDWIDLDRAVDEISQERPSLGRLVELRFYLGCTAEECSELMSLSRATVDRHWAFLRAWLYQRLRPAC
ncbi:MAG: ECF-type sigma factor [Bryobacteraceae bacterium]